MQTARSEPRGALSMDSAIAALAQAAICQPLPAKAQHCDSHGEYIATGAIYGGRREIWSRCPGCIKAEAERRQDDLLAMRVASQQAELEGKLEGALIPRRFIGRTIATYQATTDAQRAAVDVVTKYRDNIDKHVKSGSGLILSGLPGTGKSHLGVAILQEIMPRHLGLYTTCLQIIRAVRGSWRKESEHSESQILASFTNVDLLVIDEVGVQYGTDGEQTILFDVLDRRYRDMRPTIFLTNQNRAGFKKFVGDRSFDRMRETSQWVQFDWPSHRPAMNEGAE